MKYIGYGGAYGGANRLDHGCGNEGDYADYAMDVILHSCCNFLTEKKDDYAGDNADYADDNADEADDNADCSLVLTCAYD